MEYVIGWWHVGSYVKDDNHYDVLIKVVNGVFTLAKEGIYKWGSERGGLNHGTKSELGKWLFGDAKYLIGVDSAYISKFILQSNGKNKQEVRSSAKEYFKDKEEHRTEEYIKKKKREELWKKFDGVVVGIDSEVDVYESGFSVRVLFGSDISFAERKKFIVENRADFLRWTMKEVSERKNVMKKIGDIRFYKPVEIINLRIPEADVKFEVKSDLVG